MENKPHSKTRLSKELSFIDHLDELRSRIFKILISFTICTIVAYIFKDEIYNILIAPIPHSDEIKIIHLKVYDKFMAYLKISLYTGIVFSFPILVIQISRFVLPALYPSEKKWYYTSLTVVIVLFFAGSFLSYKVLAPTSVKFLLDFDREEEKVEKKPTNKEKISIPVLEKRLDEVNKKLEDVNNKLNLIIENKIKTDQVKEITQQFIDINKITQKLILNYKDFFSLNENILNSKNVTNTDQKKGNHKIETFLSILDYLDWIVFFILIVGVVFQLPLVITILAKMGIVNDKSLSKFRPYALVLILVIAAVITPPDIASQIIVGGPVYLLYEVSIFLARMMRKKAEKREENEV
ncbi:MAG: twin-arginine translocase subunit TatC [Spirochaetota bacterium]|nr:twin-arginine translocase subunit TatC [Spirochaetota bacterium]